ncbi:MAG: fatty acid alpha-hydroxylase [Geoglossum simile]|nr:MAG: fatty acid alpha-hydroxylase [Geoglossum simile]
MPGRTLPTISRVEVATHNSAKSCYVSIGREVFDITDFVNDHPGGAGLILDHGGKDVKATMEDELSHRHSDAAYEILEEHLIGFVADDLDSAIPSHTAGGIRETGGESRQKPFFQSTGLSSAEDLSTPTDAQSDFRTHKFLDLNRPLFFQVWNGGFTKDFYLEQVHRPRHYKGGESAPLFGNFLEPLSKTPWWVVPLVWLPPVIYGTFVAREGLANWGQVCIYWLLGLGLWTLVEYGLHRCLFHVDEYVLRESLLWLETADIARYLPDNRVGITLHFLLHGIHHYLPMDKYRLVMPPTLFVVLATPFWKLAQVVFYWNWHVAAAVYCGGIFGYICYDMTHYFLHHRRYALSHKYAHGLMLIRYSLPSYYRDLKKYHLQHHYADFENGFGVTSRFWDRIFGTELTPQNAKKAA